MKTILALFALAAVAALIWFFMSRSTDGGFVTLRDFPALVSALQATSAGGPFWVALIPGTAKGDGCTANLQYSFEDGVVGLDWVLLAQRNIDDGQQFLDFVRHAGLTIEEKEANDVRYLRATGAKDLATLGQDFLRQVYGVKEDDDLQLVIEGFVWRTSPRM